MSEIIEEIAEQVSETKPESAQVEAAKSDNDWNSLQKQLRLAKQENEKLKSARKVYETDNVADLEERGKYKEVNKVLKDKLSTVETERDTFKQEAIKSVDFESAFRVQALDKLPETFKKYGETMELADLLNFVNDHSNVKPVTDNDLPGTREPVSAKEIKKMTRIERNKNWPAILESYKK